MRMTPLLYSLHSGNLYGTERMALATAAGLRNDFETTFIAPAGPIHDEVRRLGFHSILFESKNRYFLDIRRFFAANKTLAAIGTRVTHTIACEMWARFYNRRCANIQVVHGGASEKLSYGSKKWLDRLAAKQVAVSKYVRERMVANGVDERSVTVIENFLSPDRVDSAPRRPASRPDRVQRIVIVSRLDPIKRIDLLLDALDLDKSLRTLEFEIYGTGSDEQALRKRALTSHSNVRLLGYCPDIPMRIAHSDLLLHLCPEEPFGLAILEAMASEVPVLVPNSGGAGDLVEPDRTGFHFQANDARSLARKLQLIMHPHESFLKNVTTEALHSLKTRFSAERGVTQYRNLIQTCLN